MAPCETEGYGFFVFDAAQFDLDGYSNCPDQGNFYGDLATKLAAENFKCTHENADNFLSGVLYEYHRKTKTKLDRRRGVVVVSFLKNEMFYALFDNQEEPELLQYGMLTLHGCPAEKQGKRSPDFFASEYPIDDRSLGD